MTSGKRTHFDATLRPNKMLHKDVPHLPVAVPALARENPGRDTGEARTVQVSSGAW